MSLIGRKKELIEMFKREIIKIKMSFNLIIENDFICQRKCLKKRKRFTAISENVLRRLEYKCRYDEDRIKEFLFLCQSSEENVVN